MPMRDDLELIVKQYPEDVQTLRVYAIGDVHVGAEQFDEEAIKKKIEIIKNDPCAAVALCGDLADYGLKNSISNVYKQTMNPREQQEYVLELFAPIADKISACVAGNHESRITREVGTCPMYDICVLLGIPEVYRENVAITKYVFGKNSGQKYQNVFVGVTSHGSTRAKHRKFSAGFENADFMVSGHTHQSEYSPRGRIRIHPEKGVAVQVPFKEIVVDAHLKPGGYSLEKEYEIAPPSELQYLELSVYRSPDKMRRRIKVMNYHAIQL